MMPKHGNRLGLLLIVALVATASASASAFDMEEIRIHGFISQGYIISTENDYFFADTEDGTFEFNEIGLNFSTQLTDRLRAGLQLLSRDLGEFGDNEVELDWAFGDYRYRNWFGLRAGRLKLAQGLYNHIRDIDAARTGVFLPTGIYNETFRDNRKSITGISLYGDLPGRVEYEMQYGKIDLDADSSVTRVFAESFGIPTNLVDINVKDRTYILGLRWTTPLAGLRVSGTYQGDFDWTTTAPGVQLETSVDVYVLSAEYTWNDLTLAAEYQIADAEITAGGVTVDEVSEEAYYLMASYRFTDWLEMGAYYSEFYPDKDDKDGDGYQARGLPSALAWFKDAALSARFDINEHWIVKVEGHYLDGLNRVEYDLADPEDTVFLFAVKTTFSF